PARCSPRTTSASCATARTRRGSRPRSTRGSSGSARPATSWPARGSRTRWWEMNLVWREARMADADLLWRWANVRETRQNSFTSSPIPYEEHVSWLAQRLGSDTTRTWIFSDGDAPVGQVRIDISGAIAEIGITVAPERRGRGCGKAMLEQA